MKNIAAFIVLMLSMIEAAHAVECDFDTIKYRNELLDIRQVKRIDPTVVKQRKWVVNQFRIVSDRSSNIQRKFKKKFRSVIRVQYEFGSCLLHGSIRQNGDWKDHVKMINGNVFQSLDVKLNDGNIAGIVRFKLLLPETRGGDSEVFATSLLQHFQLLAPRTRYVQSSVNKGQDITYLFQENPEKEFLEYNERREGPLLEALEEHFWRAVAKGEKREAVELVTARVSNSKWATGGSASAIITTSALTRLNLIYTQPYYQANGAPKDFIGREILGIDDYLYLSDGRGGLFDENLLFHNLMVILGADHGLYKHNRKYYWNSMEGGFEPVYYDGNANIEALDTIANFINEPKISKQIADTLAGLDEKLFLQNLESLGVTGINSEKLRGVIKKLQRLVLAAGSIARKKPIPQSDYAARFKPEQYAVKISELYENFSTSSVESIYTSNDGKLEAEIEICYQNACKLTVLDVAQNRNYMRGRFLFENKRLLPPTQEFKVPEGKISVSTIDLAGKKLVAKHSNGVKITSIPDNNRISIILATPDDWILFDHQDIPDISIEVEAAKGNLSTNEPSNTQRFNNFGLTGCLSFYKTSFSNTRISTKSTLCEDAINFVETTGTIARVIVDGTKADAIDADFSKIKFLDVAISDAGNDCLDFSYGDYDVQKAALHNCGDKGVSVGEHSTLNLKSTHIDGAGYGLVAKDSSKLIMLDINANSVDILCAAYNKKSEFFGAVIVDNDHFCDNGKSEFDADSKLAVGNPNEF